MELRAYGKILWRRIWIVALVFGVVALYVAYQYYTLHKAATTTKTYTSVVSIRVGLQSAQRANQSYGDYLTGAEALADEFTTGPTLTSPAFGAQVSQQIQNDLPVISQRYSSADITNMGDWKTASSITSALAAVRVHSDVTITVTWPSAAGAWAIANAVGEVSSSSIQNYLDYSVNSSSQADAGQPVAAAKVIGVPTGPVEASAAPASKTTLLLALLVVGLIIGLALAFLVEYLDDRIRTPEEIEDLLQLPLYGEVPHAPASSRSHTPARAAV